MLLRSPIDAVTQEPGKGPPPGTKPEGDGELALPAISEHDTDMSNE